MIELLVELHQWLWRSEIWRVESGIADAIGAIRLVSRIVVKSVDTDRNNMLRVIPTEERLPSLDGIGIEERRDGIRRRVKRLASTPTERLER